MIETLGVDLASELRSREQSEKFDRNSAHAPSTGSSPCALRKRQPRSELVRLRRSRSVLWHSSSRSVVVLNRFLLDCRFYIRLGLNRTRWRKLLICRSRNL